MRIQQLPADVANQIAAGEVIERPASVVKELLENSLDAEADIINIDIGYGGLNHIKISDNGTGIVADDLPLAIAAHATSKITRLTDLYAISSMGFRGEALASIASIARLSISSKPAEQQLGMLLECHEQTYTLSPFARAEGTTIDVRDIFFNAPVRKKFLKSERSEFLAIDHIVRRFALGASAITLNLTHNNKPQLHLPAAKTEHSRLARMNKLLGKTFVDESLYIDVAHAGMRLHGWTSGLNYQRSQNDKLWVYINGRMVKDKLINHAIKQAYDGLLYPGRNPGCLLYLTIDPALVDVNVHPTKHEVRFQEPRLIHDFISSQLCQVLKMPLIALPSALPASSDDAEVRESYSNHAYKPRLAVQEREVQSRIVEGSKWTLVSPRFAILSLNKTAYLIDLEGLQKQLLLASLQNASLPLAHRPLLVPVYFEHRLPIDNLTSAKTELGELGIGVEDAGDLKWAIRSLPILLPGLDIKSFLLSFFKMPTASITQRLELLVNHGATGKDYSEEQLMEFAGFVELHKEKIPVNCPFVKQLCEKTCQDLLNVY
ncbi:MAG: DNA mismatch repair endonuclease MutL [Legionella sp.]|nr:DNA mismatch repair endonuclease MutL [Legionella sp.]